MLISDFYFDILCSGEISLVCCLNWIELDFCTCKVLDGAGYELGARLRGDTFRP